LNSRKDYTVATGEREFSLNRQQPQEVNQQLKFATAAQILSTKYVQNIPTQNYVEPTKIFTSEDTFRPGNRLSNDAMNLYKRSTVQPETSSSMQDQPQITSRGTEVGTATKNLRNC
jgi:hypothetical protein